MSLKQYSVTDLVISPNQLNVLLVLESPHTDEFIHSHPVAGSSGKKLSAFFKTSGFLNSFNSTTPLGCQIKSNSYPHLGIINSSSFPMDSKFYPCGLTGSDYKRIQYLSSIKSRLEKKTQVNYQPKGLVEKYLIWNFSIRLNQVLNTPRISTQPLKIIACGHFAANFLNAANIPNVLNIPHPSSRGGLGNNSSVISNIQGLLP